MTQIPAGWYPDPDPDVPAERRGQRYWDGATWTEHVQPPPGAYPQAGGGGAPYSSTPGYGPTPGYGAAPGAVATTPDGERLAGWWQRVAAYLVDVLVMTPLVFVLAWPWMADVMRTYTEAVTAATQDRPGSVALPGPEVMASLAVPMLMVTLVGLGVNFVYNVGFLKWRAATPGKMAIGLKVRLRETPGPLSWGTVLLRWLGQNWYGLASGVPFLGSLLGLWPVVDLLWPLWDDKKQALHDKVAKTNVVRAR